MSILRLLLVPLAMIYDLVMNLRNGMYDRGVKPSASFDIPLIGVGNLAVGGTGKTPAVEYLVRLLSGDHHVVTLSRGYGRKTKGFRIADHNEDATTIGDEPLQLFLKYGEHVRVTVCEERAFAIPHIVDQHPETNVILMDDSFQHRKVKPGLQILLTEFSRPFYDDHVLPYGRLREGPEGSSRADVILVTKCPPHVDENTMMHMENEFKEFTDAPAFFTRIRYGEPRPFGGHGKEFSSNVILVSGIANHKVLVKYIEKEYKLVRHFEFNDHHNYSKGDLARLEKFYNEYKAGEAVILTTEKDMAKLVSPNFSHFTERLPFFSLPIEMEFIRNGKDFDAIVTAFVNSFSGE